MSKKQDKLKARIARLQRALKHLRKTSIPAGQARKVRRRRDREKAIDSKNRQQAAAWLNKARDLWEPRLCTMQYDEYLKTDYWQAIRKHLFALRGLKCQKCGARDCELHIHHTSYAYRGQEHLGLKFLQILCVHHHKQAHNLN